MAASNPFDELKRIRKEMDEVFLDLYVGVPLSGRRGKPFRPAADIFYADDNSQAIVIFELSGVDPSTLRVSVAERTLLVEGVRKSIEPKGHFYHHMEIDYGHFRRKLMLPFDVDPDAYELSYKDGFLTLNFRANNEEAVPETRITVAIKTNQSGG